MLVTGIASAKVLRLELANINILSKELICERTQNKWA